MRARAAYDLDRALADGTAAPSTVAVLQTLAQLRTDLEQQTAVRPEFREELRRRLVAVAAVRPVDAPSTPAPVRPPARRRVASQLTTGKTGFPAFRMDRPTSVAPFLVCRQGNGSAPMVRQ